MRQTDLESLKGWFASYCRGFYTDDEESNRNYSLKEIHTGHVCENMELLTESLDLPQGGRATAGAIALFHDVGRFEQYRRYSTFRDDSSENHAALGIRVLKSENVLSGLTESERNTIFTAISLHNAFRLPQTLEGDDLLFTRLIRDADKLDIWRIFIEFFDLPETERASAVGLGLPDLPVCTQEVLDCIGRREMVNLKILKSLNDFKLLQLSWVFDLNFPASFRLLLERGHMEQLAMTIPKGAELASTLDMLKNYAAGKAAGGEDDA